jgi:23S rRNA pseudouridine1911/1915/1917 synthase
MKVDRSFPSCIVMPETLQVLYEDNHLIAVSKPAGILVQRDASGEHSLMDVIRQYIKKRYCKPGRVFLGLIHRLDRPVSGVVLFAKTSKGASRLSEQWRSRSVMKIYWAMVHGRMNPRQGTLAAYIAKEGKGAKVVEEGAKAGREALLRYRSLRMLAGQSLLEIILDTGRKHQIRAQLADRGCPVVGDRRYGAPFSLNDRTIRLMAKSLTFTHPTTGAVITIDAPPPPWAAE